VSFFTSVVDWLCEGKRRDKEKEGRGQTSLTLEFGWMNQLASGAPAHTTVEVFAGLPPPKWLVRS
jgi:hypothetical protein